jgi:hypothetical protein
VESGGFVRFPQDYIKIVIFIVNDLSILILMLGFSRDDHSEHSFWGFGFAFAFGLWRLLGVAGAT